MKTVKLSTDSFIHFTLKNRAIEILQNGKLLVDPPHDGFGIAGVQAVSVNHGCLVPGVQLTHINPSEEEGGIVAIHFKTSSMPRVGHPEEVIWDNDVKLISPRVISLRDAVDLLPSDQEEDQFIYENELSSFTQRMV